MFEPTAVARVAAAFSDPRVGGATCNIAISNERESLWTGLQAVEYLMSISAGKSMAFGYERERTGAKNRALLAAAMMRGGFRPYDKEWWHYTLADEPFPDTYFDFPVR